MMFRHAIWSVAIPLFIQLAAVSISHAQLRIDIDDRAAADPVNTETGFQQFLIEGAENDDQATTTRTFGDIDVTISHSNSGTSLFGDRRRTTPTNAGAFTQQELLRDFIFARGTTPADGLDITISNLEPQAAYNVKIWSFDTDSNGARVSDWSANGVLVQDDYTFDGTEVPPDPMDNDVYAFDFTTIADDTGTVLVEGRWQGGACCGVFLNAFSLDLNEDILVGDFTGDGVVNGDDFNRMAANMFGHLDGISGHENGDITFDGLIDLADFHQFVEMFPAAAGAVQGVPEPSTFVLGVMALVGLRWLRRRAPRG